MFEPAFPDPELLKSWAWDCRHPSAIETAFPHALLKSWAAVMGGKRSDGRKGPPNEAHAPASDNDGFLRSLMT